MNTPKSLPLNAAYAFALEKGLEQQTTEMRTMVIDGVNDVLRVRRGWIIKMLEDHALFDAFKDQCWPFGRTHEGEAKSNRYRRAYTTYQQISAGAEDSESSKPEDSTEQAFAFEADLRDFLAHNLSVIENGLQLHQQPSHNGIEFPVESGFIDILARDRDDKLVVIELKLSRGRNRTIGQLLYYMGWIDQHLGDGQCRGMIIAREITSDLIVATARVPGVSLYSYKVSMTVQAISQTAASR